MAVTEWWRKLTGGRGDRAGKGGADGRGDKAGRGGKAGLGSTGQAGAQKQPRTTQPTTYAGPTGKPGRQADLDQARAVLGLAATRSGWVGAHLESTGHGTPTALVGSTLEEIVHAAGPVTVVAVDVPVGLPDDSRRAADAELRRFLGPQAAAVLGTPVREALYAPSYGEANRINRERQGSGVSRQAYDVRRQIMEVDAWVRHDHDHRVVEVNGEASLAQAAEGPIASRRVSAEGTSERREVLARVGIYVPTTVPHGVPVEDLIAACAAAWSAHRVKTHQAHTYPAQAETFSDGLASAVHV